MKRIICLLCILSVFFCACQTDTKKDIDESTEPMQQETEPTQPERTVSFAKNDQGNLVSDEGIEYTLVGMEWQDLKYLSEKVFYSPIEGEDAETWHLGLDFQVGMYALKDDESKNVLIRVIPENEWYAIYRKTSLPPIDFSVDNCSRLELIMGSRYTNFDTKHKTCGEGITDPDQIADFLETVRSQKSADEAGLYEMITRPDGWYENCYSYATVYGYFAEEPDIAVMMDITSFNDKAYSITIDDKEYVLPEEWLEILKKN